MIDWYMLLAPLVVLPIILLFGFVGCGLEQHGGLDDIWVHFLWSDPPGTLWPGVASLTVQVTMFSETWSGGQKPLTTTFLELLPGQLDFGGYGAPADQPITCLVACTVKDANGKPLLPTPIPPPHVLRTRDDSGLHWTFQLVSSVQQGQLIVKIVEKV